MTPVKNGWLVLALLCSILVILGLAGGDLYLLRHPAVSTKLFGKLDTGDTPTQRGPEKRAPKAPGKETCQPAPEMTFYTRLSGTSHSTRQGEKQDLAEDTPAHSADLASNSKAASKRNGTTGSSDPKLGVSSGGLPYSAERSLPEPQRGLPIYTVQVGAFTQPGIAQEWAARWKARGYEVALKPVARPKTGIIYRLYLGSFPSEKSAEELVKHLKAKEGISAFTLVLRN